MAERPRAAGCRLSLSGFGFWSHDIGGFENTARRTSTNAGARSGCSPIQPPARQQIPPRTGRTMASPATWCRHFTLKCQLMPYLYRQAVLVREFSTPMLRAMMLEFPIRRVTILTVVSMLGIQ